ncbi:MAG: DegQ family serine endoprotease [Deltaproteobacteria bacterium]|nr:DegQ family serine endoprotease [Deltaproteobacteria bacterium]
MTFGNERIGPIQRRFRLVTVIVVAAVGLLAGFAIATQREPRPIAKSLDRFAGPSVQLASSSSFVAPPNFVDLAKKVNPGVVNISTTKVIKSGAKVLRQFSPRERGERDPFHDFFGEDFFERFFGGIVPKDYVQRSLGSGFIIDREGYIITNNHVIEGASEIKVRLSNEKEFDGEVIGRDPKTDVALIRIKSWKDLPGVELGDSDKVEIGEWVMAIGNPFGLSHTVTVGIVSAKGRVIGSGPYDEFIQTDASINTGNSGGPLFNMRGEVVGINTAIVASGQGIGFAIPVNTAKEIVAQLKKKGKVTRGGIGVYVQKMTPDLAKSFGIQESKGALIAEVMPGGAAEAAGIKRGDVIVKFDGKNVDEMNELPRTVASTPVGKEVEVAILREGKPMTLKLKVGELKDEAEPAALEKAKAELGMSVQEITPEIARQLQLPEAAGVIVSQVGPGSVADEAGVQRGDLIREINGEAIRKLGDYQSAMNKAKQGEIIRLLVKRGDRNLFLTIRTTKNK